MTTSASLVEALRRVVPPSAVLDDPDVVLSLSADQAARAPVGRAAAVVRARDEAQVLAAVRVAAEHGASVVT